MNFSKTQKIAYIALLIALQVMLGRFAGIMTPIVSISFSFVPLVINAIVFGPVCATASSAIADIIGALLFPQGLGIYFTNILPVRVTLNKEQSATDRMKKLQERLISFHEHQSTPMELIASATGILLWYFSYLMKERTFVYSSVPKLAANEEKSSLSQFTNSLLIQVPKRFYVFPDDGLKIELRYDISQYAKGYTTKFLSDYHKCILDIISDRKIGGNHRKNGGQYGNDGI